MAEVKEQPTKEVKTKEPYTVDISVDINAKYVYILSQKNPQRGRVYNQRTGEPLPSPDYNTSRNILMRSSVVWPPNTLDPFSGKPRQAGRHQIRYYNGCTTLFMDDQPRDVTTIQQLIDQTQPQLFSYGRIEVMGYNNMFKTYMDWCSWNEDSPFKVPSVDSFFKKDNIEKAILSEGEQLDMLDKAMELSKNAPIEKVMAHGQFLGIQVIDFSTERELSEEAIRINYRSAAKADPAHFVRTFGDKTLLIRLWLNKAFEGGELSSTKMPNMVCWARKGVAVLDIPGLKDYDTILNKLIEFSQTKEGAEFAAQLKAIYG